MQSVVSIHRSGASLSESHMALCLSTGLGRARVSPTRHCVYPPGPVATEPMFVHHRANVWPTNQCKNTVYLSFVSQLSNSCSKITPSTDLGRQLGSKRFQLGGGGMHASSPESPRRSVNLLIPGSHWLLGVE